jgi:hypothetical protein
MPLHEDPHSFPASASVSPDTYPPLPIIPPATKSQKEGTLKYIQGQNELRPGPPGAASKATSTNNSTQAAPTDVTLGSKGANSGIPTPMEGSVSLAPSTSSDGHSVGGKGSVPLGSRTSSSGYTPRELSWVRTPRDTPSSPFEELSSHGFSSGPIPTPLAAPEDPATAAASDRAGPQTPDLPERRNEAAAPVQAASPAIPGGTGPAGTALGAPGSASSSVAGTEGGADVAAAAGARDPCLADGCGRLPSLSEKLEMAGPFLQFLGCNPADGTWRGSLMVILPPDSPVPRLILQDGKASRFLWTAPQVLVRRCSFLSWGACC